MTTKELTTQEKPSSGMELLGNLINSQALQAQINKQVFVAIQNQTEESKRELKVYTDHAINEIKKYIPLNDGEATQLQITVQKKAADITHKWIKDKFGDADYGGPDFFAKKYGHIIRALYSMLKHHFNAHKYTAILHANYEEALRYVYHFNLASLPKQTQRMTQKQLETLNKWEEHQNLQLTQSMD